jgi:hypothetical protein
MKLFSCQNCSSVFYFENRACGRCGHALGYALEQQLLRILDQNGQRVQASDRKQRVLCANAALDGCNWLVPEDQTGGYCIACRYNGTVPDLTMQQNVALWRQLLEFAKHRLFYSLLRWRLPLRTRAEDPQHGLIFNFLADTPAQKVMTGHENGINTIALAEADDIERERRHDMGEPYRTLLGHFRHEIGHHYWDLLVRDRGMMSACRELFGDERDDYQKALQRHYENGAPPDWQQHFVSAYASLHPWEDFAETWAHYLHIVDTLEMAGNFGIRLNPVLGASDGLAARIDFDPYAVVDFQRIIDAWLPFVFAMNNIGRAIGAADMYPFILAPPVLEKLGFIHGLIRKVSASWPAKAASSGGDEASQRDKSGGDRLIAAST